MIRSHMLLALAALLALALSSGCMAVKLPSAAFSGMTVQAVQKSPGSEQVELDVGFVFKVTNPLGIKLKIPGHNFGLQIDGASVASTGTKAGFDVAPGTAKKVTYDFRLDLSKNGLGKAFGKDATIAFTADANVDVPREIIDILGSIPGSSAVSDKAKQAGGDLLTTGFEALTGATEGSMGKAKLTFSHEGNLRLPKFPKISSKSGGQPQVALVGTSEVASLDNVIGQLTSKVEPLAAFLDQFENATMNEKVDLPIGELLEKIGVPANLTGAALTAINGVLQLNGKQTIGSKNNTVSVPVPLGKMTSVLGTLDPKAAQKINDFQAGWADFKNNPTLGSLVIPTALPQGIRVAAPFMIDNPNEFSIMAPSFKLGIVTADGSPVAIIGLAAPSTIGATLGNTMQQQVNVGAGSSSELQLVSEFNWDALGANLLTAAATGNAPDLSGLSLVGEISIDPGYGPITVPIRIPLAPGQTTGGSASSKSTSTSSSSSSKSSSSGSSSSSSSKSSSSGSSKDSGSSKSGGSSKDSGSSKDGGSSTKDEEPAPTKSKSKSKGK